MSNDEHYEIDAATAARRTAIKRHERLITAALCCSFLLVIALWQVPWNVVEGAGWGWLRDAAALLTLALIGLCVRGFSFRALSKAANR